jgi:hypothetical protein
MVSNMRGGFFLFFASCMTVMLLCVYLFVPETKGRTLEAMDEIFGSAYSDRDGALDVELGRYLKEIQGQREHGITAVQNGSDEATKGRRDVAEIMEDSMLGNTDAQFVGKAVQ